MIVDGLNELLSAMFLRVTGASRTGTRSGDEHAVGTSAPSRRRGTGRGLCELQNRVTG